VAWRPSPPTSCESVGTSPRARGRRPRRHRHRPRDRTNLACAGPTLCQARSCISLLIWVFTVKRCARGCVRPRPIPVGHRIEELGIEVSLLQLLGAYQRDRLIARDQTGVQRRTGSGVRGGGRRSWPTRGSRSAAGSRRSSIRGSWRLPVPWWRGIVRREQGRQCPGRVGGDRAAVGGGGCPSGPARGRPRPGPR